MNESIILALAAVAAVPALTLAFLSKRHALRTEVQINAPPSVVWRELTAAEHFGEWNPFIHEMKGTLREGDQLKVTLGAPGKSRMTFTPIVLKAERDRELRWEGKLFVDGIMNGEHVFELLAENGGTRFVHYENFHGVLVPLLKGTLERAALPGFEAMNRALKERAEAQALSAP